MTESFISIAEAVKLTGKSRRTMQRLVESLHKKQSDQVMQEKTGRGYIWKINKHAVQQAYGVAGTPADGVSPINQLQASAPPMQNSQSEKYMELVGQGFAGIMAMHEEVKQGYEKRLKEKEQQITELTQDLAQARRGWWAWVFGG